jgi:HPt (histidine-containing phosphotransfer) domain-containing protein
MPTSRPPTPALAELAAVLGEDNVRTLVRTFLRDFPVSLRDLKTGSRKDAHRIVHSMKSNSRIMGAMTLSQLAATLEDRLEQPSGADLSVREIAALATEFEAIAGPLREFAAQ